IRLLHLQRATSDDTPLAGSFHIASLDDPPRYVSVSYTWGELLLTHEIVCDGYMLLISENLYLALKRFRTTDAEVFWIDQICINQSDLQERSWQVQLMRDIYLKAEEVFAWLGNHTETTELGIAI
ncbi:HET-domain-containing protein, partial [Hyaloscypha variabilis F]